MNAKTIEKYEMCKKHLTKLKEYKDKLPFNRQMYGCGSTRPQIEHTLEHIHNNMYEKVMDAINTANDSIQKIIDSL